MPSTKGRRRRGNVKSSTGPTRERRTEIYPLRLSPRERKDLDERAAAAGLSRAAFLRSRMYLKPGAVVKDVEPLQKSEKELQLDELTRQLAAVGNNVNQIARGVNATGQLRKPGRLDRALDDIADLMAEIGKAIK